MDVVNGLEYVFTLALVKMGFHGVVINWITGLVVGYHLYKFVLIYKTCNTLEF